MGVDGPTGQTGPAGPAGADSILSPSCFPNGTAGIGQAVVFNGSCWTTDVLASPAATSIVVSSTIPFQMTRDTDGFPLAQLHHKGHIGVGVGTDHAQARLHVRQFDSEPTNLFSIETGTYNATSKTTGGNIGRVTVTSAGNTFLDPPNEVSIRVGSSRRGLRLHTNTTGGVSGMYFGNPTTADAATIQWTGNGSSTMTTTALQLVSSRHVDLRFASSLTSALYLRMEYPNLNGSGTFSRIMAQWNSYGQLRIGYDQLTSVGSSAMLHVTSLRNGTNPLFRLDATNAGGWDPVTDKITSYTTVMEVTQSGGINLRTVPGTTDDAVEWFNTGVSGSLFRVSHVGVTDISANTASTSNATYALSVLNVVAHPDNTLTKVAKFCGPNTRCLNIETGGNFFGGTHRNVVQLSTNVNSDLWFQAGTNTTAYGNIIWSVNSANTSAPTPLMHLFRSTNTTASANGTLCIGGMSCGGGVLSVMGDMYRTGQSFGPSDQRIKTEITDANLTMGYNDFKRIRFRRFRMSDYYLPYARDRHQTGVIADELQTVLPRAVVIQPAAQFVLADGNQATIDNLKTVDTSQMEMAGWLALQRAIQKIEALEVTVAAERVRARQMQTVLCSVGFMACPGV